MNDTAKDASNTNIQGALRWACDKRSHGWRSARIEPQAGSLMEKQA